MLVRVPCKSSTSIAQQLGHHRPERLKQCKMQLFDFLLRSHKAMTLSGVQCMSCVPPHRMGGQRLCCKVGPSGVSENLFLGRIVFSGLGKK